jgi:hypothetical protein
MQDTAKIVIMNIGIESLVSEETVQKSVRGKRRGIIERVLTPNTTWDKREIRLSLDRADVIFTQ